jgi:hypothetical protein
MTGTSFNYSVIPAQTLQSDAVFRGDHIGLAVSDRWTSFRHDRERVQKREKRNLSQSFSVNTGRAALISSVMVMVIVTA